MTVNANRAAMCLYSDAGYQSHQVRMVLAEKGVKAKIYYIDLQRPDKDDDGFVQELLSLNPHGSTPTIADRDLIVYETSIVIEYLEERFPHPPLMKVFPVDRAKLRLLIDRIQKEWGKLIEIIMSNPGVQANAARKQLAGGLNNLAPIFEGKRWFLSDDFSLVDCCVAPVLWRLPHLGITLPPSIQEYALRLFARDSFQASLLDIEREFNFTPVTA